MIYLLSSEIRTMISVEDWDYLIDFSKIARHGLFPEGDISVQEIIEQNSMFLARTLTSLCERSVS